MPTASQTQNPPTSAAAPQSHSLADTFYRLAQETQSQLGNVAQLAYSFGDGLQRAATDEIFDLFMPQSWTPANLYKTGSVWTRQAMMLAKALISPEGAGLIYQELKNKIDVFTLVKNLPSRLNLAPDEFVPLPVLVEKSYALEPYQALWAVEGVGHYYADSYWKRYGVPRDLLSEANAHVPPGSLTMLHAGIGLAFADRLVSELAPGSSASEARAILQQFLELCKTNSREGYLGCAIESLGIVSRDFHPDVLNLVAQEFQEVAPEFTGFFWHGAGRGLYFGRKYFLPGLCALCNVEEIAKTEQQQLSAIAGLSWATALVNQRHPAIMENQVRLHLDDSPLVRAFTNGVVSTTIMREDTTPGQQYVRDYIQHKPTDSKIARAWNDLITVPVTTALQSYYPVLLSHHAMDQVFRYQDLGKLVDNLSQAH
jgi:hypothetical protein